MTRPRGAWTAATGLGRSNRARLPFSRVHVQRIYDCALRVLEGAGAGVRDPAVLRLLEGAGCAVEHGERRARLRAGARARLDKIQEAAAA